MLYKMFSALLLYLLNVQHLTMKSTTLLIVLVTLTVFFALGEARRRSPDSADWDYDLTNGHSSNYCNDYPEYCFGRRSADYGLTNGHSPDWCNDYPEYCFGRRSADPSKYKVKKAIPHKW